MASTYIKPYKKRKGLSALETMKARFDYGLNQEKCVVVSSCLCDPVTAHAEFMLVKSQHKAKTGCQADAGTLFFRYVRLSPMPKLTAFACQQTGVAKFQAK